MVWYIIAGLAGAVAVALLVGTYVRDRRYLRSRTSEVMGEGLKAEIDQERAASLARRESWRKALDDARKG
ncbi:MAG: hypothetical protein JXA24_01890 [Proteobacteria bacterium]|nr:hypothetical protein [Pseudomonadota bacterium]